MAANAFSRAINDANISVTIGSNGRRNVGGNAHMDDSSNTSSYRGRGNFNSGGERWQRGSFRSRGRGRGRGRGHGNSYHPRSRFEEGEDDEDMEGASRRRGRYNPYRGNHGNNRIRDRSPDRDTTSGDTEWWRVTITDGRNHRRDWLMRKLKQISSVPFTEVDVHLIQDNLCFYVSEKLAADALKSLNNRITVKDGSKIYISVQPSRNPPRNPNNKGDGASNAKDYSSNTHNNKEMETDPDKIQVFQNCLAGRYQAENVKLDLTNLFADNVLRAGQIERKVYVPKFMNTILHLVNELCPNLKIMDLSNNRLQRLDNLNQLAEMCPDLDELNLSNNQIRSTTELSKISDHKNIKKLWLAQNPVQEQFKTDKPAYFKVVRNYLPDLEELDGEKMPPFIKFDLQPESNIPKSAGNYFSNKAVSDLVIKFLQSFFQVYDLEDTNERQQLLPAYHSDAIFSMCCNTGVYQEKNLKTTLDIYLKKSRNLLRLNDTSTPATELIKKKKLGVVAYLVELPHTKHQLDSFTLDVTLVTATCIAFTVKGLFLEGSEKTPRGFSRSFIAVPESSSQFLIINDQLHIRNLTEKQVEKFKGVPDTVSQQTLSYTIEQQELVKKFAAESGMNLKFSLDALVSNSWNYEKAGLQFTELKKGGKIPPAAFVL